MASFSPRRCAVALLCAVLVLGSVFARADTVVSSDVTQTGQTYNGDSFSFNLGSANVVTVQLIGSEVTGSGLTIHGYTSAPASGVSRVSMSVASTTVTQSTIVFDGYMPSNSDIRFVSTTGTLTTAQSLFDFSGLVLTGNVSVTVEESTVTWPSGSTNTGSIVSVTSGSTTASISSNSALFILNATALNGASVLNINVDSSFVVSDGSTLAVDYGNCSACSSALVDIDAPLKVDGSSMFRVSHGTVVGGTGGILSSSGSVTVSDSSLYLITDCTIESGSLFHFLTGLDSSDTSAFNFDVSTSSTVSFLNLVGPSTGISASATIPSSVDSTSTVNGGSCVINGVDLSSLSEYQANGLNVKTVVDSNGAASGTCANTICVPGNSAAGAASTGSACQCSCTSSTLNPPSCTSSTDPTQTYDASTATCTLANCASCDRLYTSRCTECNSGYKLDSNYQCQEITTTTTTTTKKGDTTTTTTSTTSTTTTSTTTSTTTTALCSVAYCEVCNPTNGAVCTTCRNGYKLTSGNCIINTDGVSGTQTVLLAAAMSVAVIAYTL